MIHFRQSVFIIKDGAGWAGRLTGAAAFAVILRDVDFFHGDIGIVVPGHSALQIGQQIVHFSGLAKADHHRIDLRLGEHIVQRLLIMGSQSAAAEGFHGKHAFPRPMAAADGSQHFLFGGKGISLANPQSGIIDQRKNHIQLCHIRRGFRHIHMMGGQADGPDQALPFGIHQSLPGAFSPCQLTGAHLMHEEDLDHIPAKGFPRLQNGLHHPFIIPAQGLGADDQIREAAPLQRLANIGIGSVILGCIDKIDAPLQRIPQDRRAFLHWQRQLAGPHREHTEAGNADLQAGLSQTVPFHGAYFRATPVRRAASATAFATAGPTRLSKAAGMM